MNSIYVQNSSNIILQVKNRYVTASTILNVHSVSHLPVIKIILL